MIIDRNNAVEKELYNAYGYTVYGKEAIYRWTYDGSGREEDCYTSLRIERDGFEIYKCNFGNNCIFDVHFKRDIDNFLWWIENDKPDTCTIEQKVQKVLINNDCMFSYMIGNRRRKEKQKAEEEKRYQKMEEERQATISEVMEYCDKKGFGVAYDGYNSMAIFRINRNVEKVKEFLADTQQFNFILDYAKKHPENELTLVYEKDCKSEWKDVLNDIKQISK